jgi:hypothetical protein
MITDAEMAQLYVRRHLPPGEYAAPCATAQWDGRMLRLYGTGQMPDAATLAAWPAFALLFVAVPPVPPDPSIAALEQDYEAATAGQGDVLPEPGFQGRLPTCRACNLWREAARAGCGACDSVRCDCTRKQLWRAGETCPEGLWPA